MQKSRYIELHCHSYFSLLDGASSPEALVQRAKMLGMDALALTDHDAVYGAVRFDKAARAAGLHPVFGAELTLDGGAHLMLLVTHQRGWQNLCGLISQARHNASKGSASLPWEALTGHTDGLIALSGCRQGAVAAALRRGDWHSAIQAACHLRDLFKRDHFWIELQHHLLPDDDALIYKLVWLARRIGVGYVATNNVHYATRAEQHVQDVLVCIRHGVTLDQASAFRRPNSEYHLKDERAMRSLFVQYPAALTNTRRIADYCRFGLDYGLQDLPIFPTPDGLSAAAYLAALCGDALPRRLSDSPPRAWEQLAHELALIGRAGLDNYFLIVWDVVRFAREQGIRCQGRGSSANSLVAYLLGISPINPLAHDLVFERFLSDERRATPDIDIDFQADRREEVIQYVYGRYGHEHAAMACTLVTFRSRSAIREVGKALGLPPEIIAQRARAIHARNPGSLIPLRITNAASFDAPIWRQFDTLCQQIAGLPRHLGIHNGGMILTGTVISERVPTEPATMPNRVVVQWDKDSLEDAGLVKVDILGLRMLSVLAETLALVAKTTGTTPDLDALTFDDPVVYELICRADTVGVFQIESRAQAQVLPRLLPRKFADLIVSISLIRPGPVQGNMVHPYLRRRAGAEPIIYLHPLLKPALAETLGVILFQEQVIKVARDLGRFTPGEGELLRRALGKRDNPAISRFEAAFIDGSHHNHATRTTASAVFNQLRAFGGYSFPKSHAAAFAVLVYQSAWLKCYHPAAFYTALLNHQPMGFWSPAVIVNDARQHGIRTLPIDIQASAARCTLEAGHIRLGLRYVHGVGESGAALIEAAQQTDSFVNLADFCRRVDLPRKRVESLILIGAFDGWRIPRRELLWQLGEVTANGNPLGLIFRHGAVDLPPFSHTELVYAEYEILGLSPGDHVMTLYRAQMTERGILSRHGLEMQPDKAVVRVAGQVVMHQAPPTAKGHHFLTLEDEHGMINVIVRPAVYAVYAKVMRESPLLLIEGVVQKSGGVVNVLAQHAEAV